MKNSPKDDEQVSIAFIKGVVNVCLIGTMISFFLIISLLVLGV